MTMMRGRFTDENRREKAQYSEQEVGQVGWPLKKRRKRGGRRAARADGMS